jgi:hypothetical protein
MCAVVHLSCKKKLTLNLLQGVKEMMVFVLIENELDCYGENHVYVLNVYKDCNYAEAEKERAIKEAKEAKMKPGKECNRSLLSYEIIEHELID